MQKYHIFFLLGLILVGCCPVQKNPCEGRGLFCYNSSACDEYLQQQQQQLAAIQAETEAARQEQQQLAKEIQQKLVEIEKRRKDISFLMTQSQKTSQKVLADRAIIQGKIEEIQRLDKEFRQIQHERQVIQQKRQALNQLLADIDKLLKEAEEALAN